MADAPNKNRVMQTPRGQFLDAPEALAKLRALLKRNPVAGTGQKSDGAKVAVEIAELVTAEMMGPQGAHVETVLAALGALAGFSVQMAIREEFVRLGKIPLAKAFAVVTTPDGGTYYFGDLLNEGIVTSKPGQLSVWGLVAGAAQHLGAPELPDLPEIFAHVAHTVGTASFGVPRLSPEHQPQQLPLELLDRLWNPVRNTLAMKVASPGQWPLVLAVAAQQSILKFKGLLEPGLAARIVMEAAIPMSRVDPGRVHQAFFW